MQMKVSAMLCPGPPVRQGPQHGYGGHVLAVLWLLRQEISNQRVAALKEQKLPAHSPIMALHRKFSIPVACLVFGVIGLALGLQHGRGGKLAAFVPGIAVVFIYYVIEYMGRQMAKGQLVSPPMAVWAPDIVLGAGGFALLFWRARSADKPIRVSIPDSWQVWRRFIKRCRRRWGRHRRTGK